MKPDSSPDALQRSSLFGAQRPWHDSDTGSVVSVQSVASAKLNECGLLHVRHTLIATKLCVAAEFRDVRAEDIPCQRTNAAK
jgi:hypothetical protein